MEAVFDIMSYVVIRKFGKGPLYGKRSFESPRFESIKSNDLNQGSQGSSSRLFRILGVVKHFIAERLL